MMASLRAHHHARGLCELYSEKWIRGHKCAATVQLHAMQEIWEVFNLEDVDFASKPPSENSLDNQLLLTISQDLVSGSVGPKTMQFQELIQGIPVLILVDSGSTNSFISSSAVQQLSDIFALPVNLNVKLANGGLMQCSSVLSDCAWEMQGCQFFHDLRVLNLHSYDLIIGMDWLELFSPMKIH